MWATILGVLLSVTKTPAFKKTVVGIAKSPKAGRYLIALIALSGMALVTLGVAMYSVPVAFIVGGILLLAIAIDASR